MIGVKERNIRHEKEPSVKRRDHDRTSVHRSCGGCNGCHQKTGIRSSQDYLSFGGSDNGEGGLNIQKPCAATFFQRNLGNSGMLALSGRGGHLPVVQRKCSCGGTCGQEEELPVQAKLTVGPVDDVYEREADRVAEQVMSMPDSGTAFRHQDGITIQRIARSAGRDGGSDIDLDRSGGRPLSESTREYVEPRFGMDFSHVKVHANSDAHQTARQINARAFTYGNHIWLGREESESDRSLMAHELTHVVQQGGASSGQSVQRYSHQNCTDADLRAHIWPADGIAKRMVEKAIRVLSGTPVDPTVTPLLTKYFMSATPDLSEVLRIFRAIKGEFDGDDYQYECEDDCDSSEYGYVYGIWTDVHLCMNVLRGRANDCIARTIVHEFAHYTESLDDEAYCKSGCGYASCPSSLSADDALDNADSYACFAYELYPMSV